MKNKRNTENFLDALDMVSDSWKTEALDTLCGKTEVKRNGRARGWKVGLIAAVMASLFTLSAFAAGNYVNSPQQAEKVARQEIGVLQDMGVLNGNIDVSRAADYVGQAGESDGGEYWYGRIFKHRYYVRWYGVGGETASGAGGKYMVNVAVDTATGKLEAITVEAAADKDRESVDSWSEELDYDPMTGERVPTQVTWELYDNYEDIFPGDMTVDRFCSLLNDYWGFKGYRIGETVDSFYGIDGKTVSGETLLRDLPQENYYLTVFFEGDQQNVPRYIQTAQFPGRVCLIVGTNHAVG